jgi:hypothetical protein
MPAPDFSLILYQFCGYHLIYFFLLIILLWLAEPLYHEPFRCAVSRLCRFRLRFAAGIDVSPVCFEHGVCGRLRQQHHGADGVVVSGLT